MDGGLAKRDMEIITGMYRQQKSYFDRNDSWESVKEDSQHQQARSEADSESQERG